MLRMGGDLDCFQHSNIKTAHSITHLTHSIVKKTEIDIDTLFYLVNTHVCVAIQLVYRYCTSKIRQNLKIESSKNLNY